MKKIFTLLLGIAFSVTIIYAQDAPPQAFSYKATIVNKNGAPVVSKTVSLQISILQGSADGIAVYVETFSPTTNEYGQIDIVIGRGTVVTGIFTSIEWSKYEYFLKTEVDLKGGTAYQLMSVAQLLSVPYALYSGEAGNGFASVYTPTERRPILGEQGNISLGAPVDPNWKFNVNGTSQLNGNSLIKGKLTLWGGLAIGSGIWLSPGSIAYGSQIILDATPLSGGKKFGIFSLADGAQEGQGKLLISGGGHGGKILMDSLGNVAIGNNNNPAYKLDVLGDINFTGDLYKNGSLFNLDYNNLINLPDLTIYATKNMNNENITNLANPVNVQDAATKAYVDELKTMIEALTERVVTLESGSGGTGTITDRDLNVYNTVTIGTQTWMVENLKTTKYNDGTPIPNLTLTADWIAENGTPIHDGAYCWYNNDITKKTPYGALYNFYAVSKGKLCPTGWHVPSDEEWTALTTYLGGESVAGGKLKEAGTTHYSAPNSGATNETGFTALPGGHRYYYGTFVDNGFYGDWWSSTVISTNAWTRSMDYDKTIVRRENSSFGNGYSVRCLKD